MRIFDEISGDVGGVLDCEQSADLPRDSKQVINARQQSQNKAYEDEFASLLDRLKNDEALRNLQWTPAPRVVYFIDEQVDDIIRECCHPNSRCILSIDTTFNVGNFYVTTTMYQSEKVISKRTGNVSYHQNSKGLPLLRPHPSGKELRTGTNCVCRQGQGQGGPSFLNH